MLDTTAVPNNVAQALERILLIALELVAIAIAIYKLFGCKEVTEIVSGTQKTTALIKTGVLNPKFYHFVKARKLNSATKLMR